MGASRKANAAKAAKAAPSVAERRAAVFALRKAGHSYAAIGAKLGCSPVTAFNDTHAVLKTLAEQAGADAAEYRAMELERLDTVARSIEGQVRQGHLGACTVWLKVIEKRARLLGLDAPTKTEAAGPGGGPISIATVSMPLDGL